MTVNEHFTFSVGYRCMNQDHACVVPEESNGLLVKRKASPACQSCSENEIEG